MTRRKNIRLMIIFSIINSTFFYTEPISVFHFRKGLYILCDHDLIFVLFLFQKDFDTFHRLFFEGWFFEGAIIANVSFEGAILMAASQMPAFDLTFS